MSITIFQSSAMDEPASFESYMAMFEKVMMEKQDNSIDIYEVYQWVCSIILL